MVELSSYGVRDGLVGAAAHSATTQLPVACGRYVTSRFRCIIVLVLPSQFSGIVGILFDMKSARSACRQIGCIVKQLRRVQMLTSTSFTLRDMI